MHDIFEDIAHMQEYIEPLNINGLHGRVLRIPATKKTKKKQEILLIYGQHASLERMYGIAEVFASEGNVTMPDLPGFGGMDSFYSIGMKPSIDNLADYLATFVKLKYRRKKVTIAAMSFGFVIVTRMLQKYPDLVNKVDNMISIVGFTHKHDFALAKPWKFFLASLSWTIKHRIPSAFFYNVVLHPAVLRTFYAHTPNAKHKFKHLSSKAKKQMIDFEVVLWRTNDVRTRGRTSYDMLTINNCDKQIALPVHHVSVKDDQYFDHPVVEQHMRIVFTDFIEYKVDIPAHAPSIIASKNDAEPFMPKKLKKVFSK